MAEFFFGLEIEGVVAAAFADLTLSSEVEPDTDQRIRPTVRLARRHDADMRLFVWHQLVVQGPTSEARKDGILAVLNAEGETVARYQLEKACPFKIEIGPVKDGVVHEAVTLTCDNVRRIT